MTDTGGWYVVWRHGRAGALEWLMLVVGVAHTVASVVIGWAAGAALGAFFLGALLVLFLFVTNHFRMSQPAPQPAEETQ